MRVFIGINKSRSVYKGTDIMLRAARQVAQHHADRMQLTVAENVPFQQYTAMLYEQDVLLDQLYSYTPSMNPLEAMSHGIICVGGGEEENYEILGETELRPIVNVEPSFESVCSKLEWLVAHPEKIDTLKRLSIQYIQRHHDHIKVAQRYLDFYNSRP